MNLPNIKERVKQIGTECQNDGLHNRIAVGVLVVSIPVTLVDARIGATAMLSALVINQTGDRICDYANRRQETKVSH